MEPSVKLRRNPLSGVILSPSFFVRGWNFSRANMLKLAVSGGSTFHFSLFLLGLLSRLSMHAWRKERERERGRRDIQFAYQRRVKNACVVRKEGLMVKPYYRAGDWVLRKHFFYLEAQHNLIFCLHPLRFLKKLNLFDYQLWHHAKKDDLAFAMHIALLLVIVTVWRRCGCHTDVTWRLTWRIMTQRKGTFPTLFLWRFLLPRLLTGRFIRGIYASNVSSTIKIYSKIDIANDTTDAFYADITPQKWWLYLSLFYFLCLKVVALAYETPLYLQTPLVELSRRKIFFASLIFHRSISCNSTWVWC